MVSRPVIEGVDEDERWGGGRRILKGSAKIILRVIV